MSSTATLVHDEHAAHPKLTDALRGQPKTVWVTAFAAVIAFMGIGLVDPILNTITEALHATPSQTTLLFASYLGVQVVAMLFTGVMSYRFGPKRTVVTGLLLIVIAAGLCALANSIGALVWLRALWGLGNAFFIATALSVIVGAATGGQKGAILLYEAALGLGLAVGPLVGAVLGNVSWRGPFAGTAVLMAIGAILCVTMLTKDPDRSHRQQVRLIDPLLALRNRNLLVTSIGSAFYTAAFFTVIAWAPFVLGKGAYFTGFVFFGWGLCTAVSGVVIAPKVAARLGERGGAILAVLVYAALMAVLALGNTTTVVVAVILSGLVSGVLNTLFTGAAMSSGTAPRAVSSAGYNFLRWLGGAASAILVGHIATWFGDMAAPFWVAVGCCVVAAGALALREAKEPADPHTVPEDAAIIGAEQ
ncbi:MFS transporter [Rhodococcus sp. D2-41]|uniref:MFS transporter n=1 Tax=Speluncibacter jeojiensis TaxID=2710754 RepID=A0A9X4LY30_9ACTN|nr:MFS transporter [Rhodococcus sp. D2-41]MDG3009739.1 MFS transporter [Rhodococcus sp. D2-41]MDG3014488.1 MFS transporter [Corynebacteriales bacterium D3-21]